jgi:NAD(P)-dependent dehydrogenase (short-subunit alcohol dehydrogenase family)
MEVMMQRFQGKAALVTGAGGNLGRAVAQALAREGAAIALVDLKPASLNETRASLGAAVDCLAVPADLIQPESVSDMTRRVLAHFKRIDILANVAGGFTMGPPLHETDDRDWDFMMNLNARTVFNCCRAVIPHMLEQGSGAIVNVSARAAAQGKARMAPYCASKAAVITLTESLAAEHRLNGINVNCILPGTIDTPQNRDAMPDADHDNWVPVSALADVVLFLASEAARCISGAAIPVYGRS